MKRHSTSQTNHWLLGILAGMCLLASGCAGPSGFVRSAPAPKQDKLVTPPTAEISVMSAEQLVVSAEKYKEQREQLELEARNALDQNMHRRAYFKYRDIETLMNVTIDMLKENQKRVQVVRERVRLGRKIDKIAHQRVELRKVIGLLWLSSRS